MHASSPQESSEAARRLGSAEVTFRYVEMRHCMMYNMLRLTGSLPRGNCVLRWPSQLRHVRKRYLLASKSRPRLPVSHTRLAMTFRYWCDVLRRQRLREKTPAFSVTAYICRFYYDIRVLQSPMSLSSDRKRITAMQLTIYYSKPSDQKQEWFFYNWNILLRQSISFV